MCTALCLHFPVWIDPFRHHGLALLDLIDVNLPLIIITDYLESLNRQIWLAEKEATNSILEHAHVRHSNGTPGLGQLLGGKGLDIEPISLPHSFLPELAPLPHICIRVIRCLVLKRGRGDLFVDLVLEYWPTELGCIDDKCCQELFLLTSQELVGCSESF